MHGTYYPYGAHPIRCRAAIRVTAESTFKSASAGFASVG